MRRAGTALLLGLLSAPLSCQEELATLVARLGAEDHRIRSSAYRELLRHKEPVVARLIRKQIGTFPMAGRLLALNVLNRQPVKSRMSAYEDLMRAEQPFLRAVGAAKCLRWPALAKALGAVPESERAAMLGRIRNIRHPGVLRQIRGWLQPEPSPGVVMTVLRDLLRREQGSTDRTRKAVAPLVESAQLAVHATALAYLARDDKGHAIAFAALMKEEPSQFWRVRDLLETEHQLSHHVIEVMAAALAAPRNERDITRLAAMLRKQSPGSTVAALRHLLDHEKDDFRLAALQALITVPGGIETKDLQPILRSGGVEARIVAVGALRRRDDMSGLPILLELLPAAGPHKAAATQVLARFRNRKVVPVLLELLDDKDLQVRRNAWSGIQQLMRGLFPYRRFDFAGSGYRPEAASRVAAISGLRAWWASVQ